MTDSGIQGLSQSEASRRLAQEGFNEIESGKKRDLTSIAREVVFEPMLLLLMASGGIYLLLGDVGEALVLLAFVFVVMILTIYQENKTERALEALADLTSPRALVVRDSVERRIAGREVVRGDILCLAEGDRVAADALILQCNDFCVDESLLTGESMPVRKKAAIGIEAAQPPGGDDLPFVYAGTVVTLGRGLAQVVATGSKSEIGKIGKSLSSIEPEKTPLQKEVGRLVKKLAWMGVFLSLLLIVLYALTRGNWLNGILAGITMAMAILPEEFPVVLTVFLALGAWRIAKQQVLTRRLPAVETLGSASVLCVDKTGTLTENKMSVAKLVVSGMSLDLGHSAEFPPEVFHELVEYSILASEKDPFDPMEKAFHWLGNLHFAGTEHLHPDWILVHEYALSPELMVMSHVWKGGNASVIAAKGAPEAVFALCRLAAQDAEKWSLEVEKMAAIGLRVLGVAKATHQGDIWPAKQSDFDFEFLGLVGLSDPVRDNVPEALSQCRNAGIRVVMVTGDNHLTAMAIAQKVGLEAGSGPVLGNEISAMSDAQLRECVKECNIFARVVPSQKLRLVEAFRENGQIVAMTGDGVNDAPALKAAHIGIAMGFRGTDVARESAALVLLQDDFASIVHAVGLGRRIYSNLSKALSYSLAVHVPIAGMSLIPVLLGWPMVFLPIHVAFLELIINPACALVFEAEVGEKALMNQPPRKIEKKIFDRKTVSISLLQGMVVLVAVCFLYGHFLFRGEAYARTIAFGTFVFANIGLIHVNRSWSETVFSTFKKKNPVLWWITFGAISSLLMVLTLPSVHSFFGFSSISGADLFLGFLVGLASVSWFEFYKSVNAP